MITVWKEYKKLEKSRPLSPWRVFFSVYQGYLKPSYIWYLHLGHYIWTILFNARKQVLMSEPPQRIYSRFLFPFIKYKKIHLKMHFLSSAEAAQWKEHLAYSLWGQTPWDWSLPPFPSHLLHHHKLTRWNYLTISPCITSVHSRLHTNVSVSASDQFLPYARSCPLLWSHPPLQTTSLPNSWPTLTTSNVFLFITPYLTVTGVCIMTYSLLCTI